jgi:hypothetical protein
MSSRIDSINMPWATQAMKSRMLSAPESGGKALRKAWWAALLASYVYSDPLPWRHGRRAFRLRSNGLLMGWRKRRLILRGFGLRMWL